MRVDAWVVQRAIYGAERISVKENSNWITANRFTETQIKVFSAKPSLEAGFGRESFMEKSAATAGIMLDFITDSVLLEFDYRAFPVTDRRLCWFDILVDGSLYHRTGKSGQEKVAGRASISLPKGEKRVTIYFPCLYKGEIRNLTIDDGATFNPFWEGRKHHRILFVGDSITQGYATAYTSLTYSNLLARKLDAESMNQGIGGAIYNAEDLDENLRFKPDIVIVAYGTNDWYWRRDVESTAPAYYRRLTEIYPEAKIYALLPIWRGDREMLELMGRRSFLDHRTVIQKAAESYENIMVIETMGFVPHDPNFFEDQALHPNELGFLMFADALAEVIGPDL